MMIRNTIIVGCLLVLTACYPAYKTRQPAINLTIVNAQKMPIEAAKVVLNTRAHASGVNEFAVETSDAKGLVAFKSDKKVELEVMALHGSLNYFWNICIEKKDYITQNLQIEEPSEADKLKLISLKAGESEACLSE